MAVTTMLDIISVETGYEPSEEHFSYLNSFVSQEKRERISRFRHKKDAVNTLMGEVLARHMISACSGLPAARLEIEPDPHGKPVPVNAPGVHFNISHSGDLVVCAVSSHPVGVDIELVRSANPGIAKRFFREDECLYISRSEDFLK